jgi:hypothetical protein
MIRADSRVLSAFMTYLSPRFCSADHGAFTADAQPL